MSNGSLNIAGRAFRSRLILGTGKFSSPEAMRAALDASGCEMVTVALRSDGTIYAMNGYPRIEFTVASEALARDVVHAFLRFGVVSKFWQKTEKSWRDRSREVGGVVDEHTVSLAAGDELLQVARQIGDNVGAHEAREIVLEFNRYEIEHEHHDHDAHAHEHHEHRPYDYAEAVESFRAEKDAFFGSQAGSPIPEVLASSEMIAPAGRVAAPRW